MRHYTSTAFLSISGSDVAVHRLFLDLITAIQPLSQLPFHLEYDFELNRLERSQQRLAAADSDPAAGVRRSLARQSSAGEAQVDVGRRLRTVLGRLGSSATQSLVLAKSAVRASSSLSSAAMPRPPRFLINFHFSSSVFPFLDLLHKIAPQHRSPNHARTAIFFTEMSIYFGYLPK